MSLVFISRNGYRDSVGLGGYSLVAFRGYPRTWVVTQSDATGARGEDYSASVVDWRHQQFYLQCFVLRVSLTICLSFYSLTCFHLLVTLSFTLVPFSLLWQLPPSPCCSSSKKKKQFRPAHFSASSVSFHLMTLFVCSRRVCKSVVSPLSKIRCVTLGCGWLSY